MSRGLNHFVDATSGVQTLDELVEIEKRYLNAAVKEPKVKEGGEHEVLSLASLIIRSYKSFGFTGAIVYGVQGVGKSVYTIAVIKQVLEKTLKQPVEWERVYTGYLVFRVEDFIARLSSSTERLPCIGWDDCGVHASSDLWFLERREAYALSSLFQTIRTMTAGLIMNTLEPKFILSKLRCHGMFFVPIVRYDKKYSVAVGYALGVLPNGKTFIRRVFTDVFRREKWDWYPDYLEIRRRYAQEALNNLLKLMRAGRKKKSNNGSGRRGRRLPPEKKERIIKMLRAGVPVREIAKQLHASTRTIVNIRKELKAGGGL